jgi:hypothetical protein
VRDTTVRGSYAALYLCLYSNKQAAGLDMQQRWLASSEKGVERDGGSVAESGTGGKCSPLTVLDQFCSKIFYVFFFFFRLWRGAGWFS